jgi:hypothetical protein
LLVILFISCYRPLFEKAEIKKGTTIGFGVGVGTCVAPTNMSDLLFTNFDYCLVGTGTLFIRHGFSNKIAIFGQVSAGSGKWLTKDDVSWDYSQGTPVILDIQAGMKFKTGQKGAMRVGIGFPNIVDLTYLYDYNSLLTQSFSIGIPGAGIGLIIHPKLSNKRIGHISIQCSRPWLRYGHKIRPAFFLGFGIE